MTDPRLVDLIPRYESALASLGRRPRGVEQYVYALRRFLTWLATEGIEAPTPATLTRARILAYRDHLGSRIASSSIINDLSVLSSFCGWLIEHELLVSNPVDTIARPKKREANPQPLTPEQITILLETIATPPNLPPDKAYLWRRNRRIVYLMLFAGFRRSDCLVVRWHHVDFASEMIQLEGDTKGARPRRVAMHPDLIVELLTAPDYERPPGFALCGSASGEPLSRGGIEHVFDRWLDHDMRIDDKLGVHLHPHKLRTTFATFFAWSGGHTFTLQQLLGHRDPKTTTFYVLTDDEEKRQQIKKLRFTRQRPSKD